MWNHRIVMRVGVFNDVEIFLHSALGVGKKRPMRTNSRAKFVGLNEIARAYCELVDNTQPRARGAVGPDPHAVAGPLDSKYRG